MYGEETAERQYPKKKYTMRIGLRQGDRDTEVGFVDEKKEEIPGGRQRPY